MSSIAVIGAVGAAATVASQTGLLGGGGGGSAAAEEAAPSGGGSSASARSNQFGSVNYRSSDIREASRTNNQTPTSTAVANDPFAAENVTAPAMRSESWVLLVVAGIAAVFGLGFLFLRKGKK